MRLLVSVIFLGLVGCGGTNLDEISQKIDKYEASDNSSDGYEALRFLFASAKTYDYVYDKKEERLTVIKSWLNKISDISMDNEDFELFFASKDVYWNTGISNSQFAVIAESYKGQSSSVYYKLSKWHSLSGSHKSSYEAMLKAVEYDHSYSNYLLEILRHFGCMDTAAIWEEYANTQTYSSYDIEGTVYPPQPSALGVEGIVKGRILLRKGVIPELEEACPISQFY